MAAPTPEGGFQVYDSYKTDPRFQKYFTIGAGCMLALAVASQLPSAVQAVINGRATDPTRLVGLRAQFLQNGSLPPKGPPHTGKLAPPCRLPTVGIVIKSLVQKSVLWTPRVRVSQQFQWSANLNLGAILVALLVPTALVATVFPEAQLSNNPNRLGFLAVATLPWLFLLGLKTPISLVGLSYDRVNYLHRWLGRAALVLVLAHFGLWAKQWAQYGSSYLADRMAGQKERRGLFALIMMLVLALPSLSFVRHAQGWGWRLFKTLHCIGFVGLAVGVNKHTIYAWRWTVGAIVIYAVDATLRTTRLRFKDVVVEALPEAGPHGEFRMAKISLYNITSGWRGGQHVRLRLLLPVMPRPVDTPWYSGFFASLFRAARPLESHPLTLASAPAPLSFSTGPGQAHLYASAVSSSGWTSDLFEIAKSTQGRRLKAIALVDGPYGGLSPFANLDTNETILFFAGGSGMSFVLGVADEMVGRAIHAARGSRLGKGSKVRRIEIVWAVRDAGCVEWFAEPLSKLLRAAAEAGAVHVTLTVHGQLAQSEGLPACCGPPPLVSYLPDALTAPGLAGLVAFNDCRCAADCALDALVEDSISPCATCEVCTCQDTCPGAGGGAGGSCAPANGRAEGSEGLPVLGKDGGDARDDISTALPPGAPGSGPGRTCCGRCGTGRNRMKPSRSRASSPSSGKGEKTALSWGAPADGAEVRTGGLGVVVCGPRALIADVRNAVAGLPLSQMIRIGGVQVHAENFGL